VDAIQIDVAVAELEADGMAGGAATGEVIAAGDLVVEAVKGAEGLERDVITPAGGGEGGQGRKRPKRDTPLSS
jgi:hypothetical protein